MGRLAPGLSGCSGRTIEAVTEGRLALACNVLGSYAAERPVRASGGQMQILAMQGCANVMLRTAIIPATATETEAAGALIDMLAARDLRAEPGDWPLQPLAPMGTGAAAGFGPIRLGPALMVNLDPLNRRAFLAAWEETMDQR